MLATCIDQLEREGYCIVKNAISADTIKTMLQKIEYLYEKGEKPSAEKIPKLNRLSRVVYNPEHKDVFFSKAMFSIKPLRDILIHFLNNDCLCRACALQLTSDCLPNQLRT